MTSKKQWALVALGLSCAVGCVAYLNGSTTTEIPNVQFQAFDDPNVRYGEAVLYDHTGFGGRSLTLGINQYINLGDLGWNDKIASLKLGKGIRLELCEHGGCKGYWDDKLSFLGPYKADNLHRWNDEASVAITHPYDETDINQARVQIFASCNFQGGPAGTFPIREYDNEAIKAHGVDQGGYADAASSIIIPKGLTIQAWQGKWFTGNSITLAGPLSVDLCTSQDPSGWNDKIGSLKVFKSASFDVKGTWELVASANGLLKRTITIGTTHTQTNEVDETLTESFGSSIEAGFEFEGISSKVAVTTETSKSVRNMVSKSLEMKKEESIEISCPDKGPDNLVAMHRWTLVGKRQSDDVSFILRDEHIRCRYNQNAYISIDCPPTKCADAECTRCTDNSWIRQ